MVRYINTDEFEKQINPYDTDDRVDKAMYIFAHNMMMSTPTADVRENVHAHWKIVYNEDCDGGGKYICGNCGHSFSFGAYFELCRFDYCPNCGAVMDERREDV